MVAREKVTRIKSPSLIQLIGDSPFDTDECMVFMYRIKSC